METIIGTKENNYTVRLSNGELFKLPSHFYRPYYSFVEGKLIYDDICSQCAKSKQIGNHFI